MTDLVKTNKRSHFADKNTGISLITSLMMLIVITILALASARMALFDQKSSRNQRDQDIAFQAAEAALKDAENDIYNVRTNIFKNGAAFSIACTPLNATCTESNITTARGTFSACHGLCYGGTDDAPVWLDANVKFADETSNDRRTIQIGQYTGIDYPVATTSSPIGLPSQKPRYIIEKIQVLTSNTSADLSQGNDSYFYRVTAVGFGANSSIQVILQSVFKSK